MEIKATQKFVRMSPRKLRLVIPLVKNLPPAQALEILPHAGKRAAEPLAKVIRTAIANAKQQKVSESDLVFKEIEINEGPRLKRWKFGARGRVKPYARRMSHIRIILETKEPEAIKKAREEIKKKDAKVKLDEKVATQKVLRRPLKIIRKKGKTGSKGRSIKSKKDAKHV